MAALLRNAVKEKLARGELVASMTVRLVPGVEIVRIAKSAGFDSLYIDLEHSSFTLHTARRAAALHDYLAELPVPLVIDHFGLARSASDGAPLLSLLHRGNTWIKLSAPHRVGGEVDEVARLFIAARADRLVWGTDWPHPGMGPRTAQVIQPFDDIDDAAALARLARWAASETVLQQILVDNPARLYDFQESV